MQLSISNSTARLPCSICICIPPLLQSAAFVCNASSEASLASCWKESSWFGSAFQRNPGASPYQRCHCLKAFASLHRLATAAPTLAVIGCLGGTFPSIWQRLSMGSSDEWKRCTERPQPWQSRWSSRCHRCLSPIWVAEARAGMSLSLYQRCAAANIEGFGCYRGFGSNIFAVCSQAEVFLWKSSNILWT